MQGRKKSLSRAFYRNLAIQTEGKILAELSDNLWKHAVPGGLQPLTTGCGDCWLVVCVNLAQGLGRGSNSGLEPGSGGGRDCGFSTETGSLVPSSQSSDLTQGRELQRAGGGSQCKQVYSARLLELEGSPGWGARDGRGERTRADPSFHGNPRAPALWALA